MKRYTSFGELLVDYRDYNQISQADLAAVLNIDVRTVIRWEKNETMIKSDKEEELVEITFIPYQVIHNLNASVVIPTYYDFNIRKYALSEISGDLPDADWFKDQINVTTKRIRPIQYESDTDNILKYTKFQYSTSKPISRDLIWEATRILPEINLVIMDGNGFYSGHIVIFPIQFNTYQKLKTRKMDEGQLTIRDLVDPRNEEKPVFHGFDITADCNENLYYIVSALLKYFEKLATVEYIYSAITSRYDTFEICKKIGLNIVWEDKTMQTSQGLKAPLRFQEGNFSAFLHKV